MNNTSVSAGSGSEEDSVARRALIGSILTLLIVWTLLGNLTVCVAVFRFRHLRAKVTNIFIVSLAVSDLLVAVLVMPWRAVTEVTGFWPFGAFCNTWVACDIMCSTASILNLCIISVDRYWAISSPFSYERSMNRRVAVIMIAVTWTVSVVISFVPVQLDWHRRADIIITRDLDGHHHNLTLFDDGSCDTRLSRTYAISSSLVSFYIPVAIMIVTYTRIYGIAQLQIRRISSLERAAEHAQNCRSDAPALSPRAQVRPRGGSDDLCLQLSSNHHHHHHHPRHRSHSHPHSYPHPGHPTPLSHRALRVSIRKETKVLKTLSIIMGVFVFCWFPFFVLNCALPFCPGSESPPGAQRGPHCVSETTFDVFVWFGWSNSSLNPVIYAFNADFRDAFLRLLGCRRGGSARWVSAAVDTVVASNEKHDSSLNTMEPGVAYCVNARGSGDSGTITVSLFYHNNRDPASGTQVMDTLDTVEDGNKANGTDDTDKQTQLPV